MRPFVILVAILNCNIGFSQWAIKSPGLFDPIEVFSIGFVNQNTLVAGGHSILVQENTLGIPIKDSVYLFHTNNSGNDWESLKVPFGNNAFLTSLSTPSPDVWYIGGLINLANVKLIRTIDHGLNWKDITPPLSSTGSWISLINFYNSESGIIICDPEANKFTIFHTENGGNTWSEIPEGTIPDANIGEYTIRGQALGDHIWFTTNNGRIFKSSDKGFHWEAFQTILPNLEKVSFSDTLNGIALYGFVTLDFNTSPIIITADGGKTWKTLNITPLGPKTGIFGASYIPNSSYIMLTTAKNSLLTGDFATWISPDRGETWQQISSGENIYTINFLDAETGWGGEGQQFAHPTRMFQYTGSPLVGLFSDKVLQADWEVFPNPATDRVQVRIKEDKPAAYLLLVNDLQGKLILRKDWDGVDMLDLDLGACASGMYTVTLASKEGKAVRKLVAAR